MRLVTFNILHGRSLTDGRVDASRFVQAIRDLRPDVLALQEVDQAQKRSGQVDFTALAAEVMEAVDYRFVAAIVGTPGEVWTAATGAEQPGSAAYGIALVSRFPVAAWTVTRLRALPVSVPLRFSQRKRPVMVKDEPRVAVAAELQGDLPVRTVASTHLSFIRGWNAVQLRHLCRVIGGLPGRRVLMGDLNQGPVQARALTGWHPLVHGRTWPADHPQTQLDHVLADQPVPVRRAEITEMALSDHRAVVVDLER